MLEPLGMKLVNERCQSQPAGRKANFRAANNRTDVYRYRVSQCGLEQLWVHKCTQGHGNEHSSFHLPSSAAK